MIKITLEKASDWNYKKEIEVKNYNELIKILKKRSNRWILDFDEDTAKEYDDFVE